MIPLPYKHAIMDSNIIQFPVRSMKLLYMLSADNIWGKATQGQQASPRETNVFTPERLRAKKEYDTNMKRETGRNNSDPSLPLRHPRQLRTVLGKLDGK
jgi:hypothetical protein